MGGFSDWDWGGRGDRPRASRRPSAVDFAAFERVVVEETVSGTIAALGRDGGVLDRTRAALVARLDRWADTHGYAIDTVSWESATADGAPLGTVLGTVRLRAIAEVFPRTDGEWPAVRAAIAEDVADRAAAQAHRERVEGRLDALRGSADLWGDRALRGR